MTEENGPDKNGSYPESWSDEAKHQFKQGEQMLRLMGLDEATIAAMGRAIGDLYDPKTGKLNLEDFEDFKDAVLPALLDSPVLEETLNATELLDSPALRTFWFSSEEIQPCLEDWEECLAIWQEQNEDLTACELLMDGTFTEERQAIGAILFSHYESLLTPELERELYEAIFDISKNGPVDQKELAKSAMATFTLFPGNSNAFLQYLFVKSLVHNGGIAQAIGRSVEEKSDDTEQVNSLQENIEDAVFAILCEGEDSYWDEDEDEDEDEAWDEDEDEWDENKNWNEDDEDDGERKDEIPF